MAKLKKTREGMKVKGMFRIRIDEGGKIVSDSGWHTNLITNLGFNNFLVKSLGTGLGGVPISHSALGTGGAPIATDTTLSGEVSTNGSGSRCAGADVV